MKRLLLFLIGIFIFVLWFYYIDPRQTWDGIKAVNLFYLSLGYIFFLISYGFKVVRWALILRTLKKVPFIQVTKYYCASEFINNFMPVKIGDLSKSIFLKKDYGIDISASVSTMIVDRIYGIIVRLGVICFIPFIALKMYPYLRSYLIYVICLTVIILIFFILLAKNPSYFLKVIDRLLFFLPKSWKRQIISFLEESILTIRKIHPHKRDVLIFLAFSIMGLVAQAYRTYFFFRAVGIEMPLSIFIITTTLMDFLIILPSPPASLGTTEWYTNIIYTLGLGVSKNSVASITLLTHGINLCITGILGFISLTSIGHGIFQPRDQKVKVVSEHPEELVSNL
jgi:uncharacterized protein (TIRG00374 family)